MRTINLPPDPNNLLESMRSVGYSLETAVADIIDNSISAAASNIELSFSPYEEPYFCILDDGAGMSRDELIAAMRHGSQNPSITRNKADMGRFGLGLKTASMSQCRKLIVASKKSGQMHAVAWDLDHIKNTLSWDLLELDLYEIENLPNYDKLNELISGTIVIWMNLDMFQSGESSLDDAFRVKIESLRLHTSLIFHRFISGGSGLKKIKFSIANNELASTDPYLLSSEKTQKLPSETFSIEDASIRITPIVLPHPRDISPEDLLSLSGEHGLRKNQGFYLYRNNRLIIYGTWFGLIRQDEASKLARVQVDFTNELDHLWKLDVKKTSVWPPKIVRDNLARTVKKIATRAKLVPTTRVRAHNVKSEQIWKRTETREGCYYTINRAHPLIGPFFNKTSHSTHLEDLLVFIEQNIPIDAMYGDLSSDKQVSTSDDVEFSLVKETFQSQLRRIRESGYSDSQYATTRASLLAIYPYSNFKNKLEDVDA